MLRPYVFSNSKIHKIQSFVNHVMLDVIFNAPKIATPIFTSNLVMAKYRMLIDDINVEYVLNPLVDMYRICKILSPKDLKILKRAVHDNNKIRQLCNGDIQPIRYSDIDKIDSDLVKAIKVFCRHLYDDVVGLAPFYNNYEDINAYYKKLVQRSSACRCCGINKVLTKFHTNRSALDHYLPRNHYPFNSLNFKNLMPICDTCNSKYKLGQDTLYKTENKGRKNETITKIRAFYPFRRDIPDINIEINFSKPFDSTIEPKDIELTLECLGFEEEVENWDRLFGIKENYKAECCTDEMRLQYEEEYIAEMAYGKTHAQYIELLSRNKYANSNFLKIPFLNAI